VVVESLHAVTYFARPCRHAVRDLGLIGFWQGYFAARAAPLGRVGAGPVAAAFFNFNPAMVAASVPSCWDVVDPVALTAVRAAAAATALEELCSADTLDAVVGALPSLRVAATACGGAGRVLARSNWALWSSLEAALRRRGLARRTLDVAEVWQACTTLREHRGDGHVAALMAHDLGGCEAHVLAAAVAGVLPEVLRDNRGWSEAQWGEAEDRLTNRGLVGQDGRATTDGHALHRSVEVSTDELAEPAYADLSDGAVDALFAALAAVAREIQGSGLVPFPNPMGLPPIGSR
jgi:hypothetical protein